VPCINGYMMFTGSRDPQEADHRILSSSSSRGSDHIQVKAFIIAPHDEVIDDRKERAAPSPSRRLKRYRRGGRPRSISSSAFPCPYAEIGTSPDRINRIIRIVKLSPEETICFRDLR